MSVYRSKVFLRVLNSCARISTRSSNSRHLSQRADKTSSPNLNLLSKYINVIDRLKLRDARFIYTGGTNKNEKVSYDRLKNWFYIP